MQHPLRRTLVLQQYLAAIPLNNPQAACKHEAKCIAILKISPQINYGLNRVFFDF
jgi:hypothetical protein